MTIGNIPGYYPNYSPYNNAVSPSVRPADDSITPNVTTPSGETDEHSADPDKVKKPGKRSAPEDCETCANRKYQDGSDEGNVSFKSASHISPESAGARVRAHEGEHVSLSLIHI